MNDTIDTMISLEEASSILENHRLKTDLETIQLDSAYYRILAEDIVAGRDLPPFNKSAMDGYACKRSELGKPLVVNETIPAGISPRFKVNPGTCTKIMTGAKVPDGADCVIKQEETTLLDDGKVLFNGKETSNNICYLSEDVQVGDVMLKRGSQLHPQNMGIAASAGRREVEVFSKCNVGIIATGSELVEPGEIPGETSIINSNAWQLIGHIESSGHNAHYYGIVKDDVRSISNKMNVALNVCNVVLLTGGASVGAFDHVEEVLVSLGFSVAFQKLSIQPGKPVTFASKDHKFCFGLSGNPVSCFLQFELLVKPFLFSISGDIYKPMKIRTRLQTEFSRKKTERIYFLPVKKTTEGYVSVLDYHGSAHLTALTDLDGFVEIPKGLNHVKQGEEVYVRFV